MNTRNTLFAFFAFALQPIISGTAHSQEAMPGSIYRNSIGMEFVSVQAGKFLMGSPNSDPEARAFEKPQHEVTISRPFYLGRFEVTQAQWEAVMGSNPYTLDRSNPYYNLPGMAQRITRPNHPATMSWNDVQEFIAG